MKIINSIVVFPSGLNAFESPIVIRFPLSVLRAEGYIFSYCLCHFVVIFQRKSSLDSILTVQRGTEQSVCSAEHRQLESDTTKITDILWHIHEEEDSDSASWDL